MPVSILVEIWREDGSWVFLVDISKKQVAWYLTGTSMVNIYEGS
jgi:hypothetical protein